MPQSPEQSLVATLQEPVPQSLESIFKEYIEATCQGDTDAQRVFAMMQVATLIRQAEELGHGAVLEPARHVLVSIAHNKDCYSCVARSPISMGVSTCPWLFFELGKFVQQRHFWPSGLLPG